MKGERFGVIFLAVVGIIYAALFATSPDSAFAAIASSKGVLFKVIPVFVLVFALMALTNYFVRPKTVARFMGNGSGIRGWVIAIVGGILSTGPVYMWFPLLKDLRERGVSDALISTFLYNRAIKIALLPMIIAYFGLKYTIVLTAVMIVASVMQGMVFEIIGKRENKREK